VQRFEYDLEFGLDAPTLRDSRAAKLRRESGRGATSEAELRWLFRLEGEVIRAQARRFRST